MKFKRLIELASKHGFITNGAAFPGGKTWTWVISREGVSGAIAFTQLCAISGIAPGTMQKDFDAVVYRKYFVVRGTMETAEEDE